jgi:hypothetical protein
MNTTEPFWLVLETGAWKRFPPPTPMKQLQDFFEEEWNKISLQTVQSLYESFPRTGAVLKAKFCPTSY